MCNYWGGSSEGQVLRAECHLLFHCLSLCELQFWAQRLLCMELNSGSGLSPGAGPGFEPFITYTVVGCDKHISVKVLC